MKEQTSYIFEKHIPYTVISNQLVQDKNLSLKAKGLACYMASLPEGWSFSYRRLMEATGEGERVIRGALNELIELGYIVRTVTRAEKGFGSCKYDLYPVPQNVCIQNVCLQNVGIQNVGALKEDNNKINNNKINIYSEKKSESKKHYAEKVMLTEDEYQKLVNTLGEQGTKQMIERLDDYKVSTGKKYASDYRTILNWYKRDLEKQPKQTTTSKVDMSTYDLKQTDFLDELFEGE